MSRLRICRAPLIQAEIRVPGDKSISHRAVILASLSNGTCVLKGFLPGADCMATVNAMRALGVEIEQPEPTTLIIHGTHRKLKEPADVIDCDELTLDFTGCNEDNLKLFAAATITIRRQNVWRKKGVPAIEVVMVKDYIPGSRMAEPVTVDSTIANAKTMTPAESTPNSASGAAIRKLRSTPSEGPIATCTPALRNSQHSPLPARSLCPASPAVRRPNAARCSAASASTGGFRKIWAGVAKRLLNLSAYRGHVAQMPPRTEALDQESKA
jgi:hypothetical protein